MQIKIKTTVNTKKVLSHINKLQIKTSAAIIGMNAYQAKAMNR